LVGWLCLFGIRIFLFRQVGRDAALGRCTHSRCRRRSRPRAGSRRRCCSPRSRCTGSSRPRARGRRR
jgi:hypothetical protein